jgi:hypothetical protein
MSTQKIMYAVSVTSKAEPGAIDSVLARVSAPAAPQPSAAIRKATRLANPTRTPRLSAAVSLSLMAVRPSPRRLRSNAKTPPMVSTTITSATQ